jgi:hypothetical protein
MSLREPCEHGRYERHTWADLESGLEGSLTIPCPGGRVLSDAEALRARLFETCGECDGSGEEMADSGSELGIPGGMVAIGLCPSCGGSGETPKGGVHEAFGWPEGSYVVSASLLEGAE